MNSTAMSRNHSGDAQNGGVRRVLIRNSYLVFLTLVTVSLAGCADLESTSGADPSTPSITTQPTNQTVTAGQTATFWVVASGIAPLSYQWKKNGTSISGATSVFYTTPATTTSDSGAAFTVAVSNSRGSVHSSTAALTVSAPGHLNASLSNLNFGDVAVGSSTTRPVTLTASGKSNVTISKVSISGSGFNASGVPTGIILTPGQSATLNVTFTPVATGSATGNITVTSDASNSPATISLSTSGVQPEQHSVFLTWAASTSIVIGYNVYRATMSDRPYVKLGSSVNATTTFADTTVQAGQTYYYAVTSVDSSNVESTYSNEVSATIPMA
jgi:hypothetical protein